ncbi:WXG100 family type VII secretion target [Streptomyces sp. NBC_01525]|uniref:WXG100 family type VII secretion target n=1 Tax=Streptomyces sp. NBC_01525 TaxID=2903893 RepID=UPI00386A6A23
MAQQPTSVELEGMKRAQGSFQTALDHASGSYTQMDGQIQGLRASWTGQAANIYQNAMQEWLNDFNVVNQQLGLMLEKLQENTGVYANTHEQTQQEAGQAARLISSGHAGLPGFPS